MSMLSDYVAKHGTDGLNKSITKDNSQTASKDAEVKSSTGKKKTSTKKNNSISINALGAGDYGASKNTRADNALRASGTSAAGAIVYLKGLLDEIDAQTKARDEADSARLKAGRDAAEQGIDINTADGGLKKAHEEQQKDFESLVKKKVLSFSFLF